MRKEFLFLTGIFIVVVIGIFVNAGSTSDSGFSTASVTVPGWVSLTLLNVPLDFGSMTPAQVNKDGLNITVRIGNETNIIVKILTKANNSYFVSPYNYFPVSNMKWATSSHGTYTDYSITNSQVYTGCSFGNDYPIYHRLYVPPGQPAGLYTVRIVITATI